MVPAAADDLERTQLASRAAAGGGQEQQDAPAQVGRFRIKQRIGAGGMGVVHLAHDPDLDREVAVKLVNPDVTSDPHSSLRLLREAQALAKLQHSNVVTVYEAGTIGAQVWVAMELIRGCTLHAWLRSERRTWTEVLDVMLAAGQGLAAAHEAGLVHRDIKPENIMISAGGRVRVMDFGLVRLQVGDLPVHASGPVEPGLSGAGVLVGTPRYMAPEQYRLLEADARSDQFAWCVTCWESVYGHSPFIGGTLYARLEAITRGQFAATPVDHPAPEWLRELLKRGLSDDPARRFASMQELFAAISAYRPTFAGEIAAKNAASLRLEVKIGLFLVPAFWILDWLVLRPWVWFTLGLRLVCAIVAAGIIVLSVRSPRLLQRFAVPLAFSYSQLVVWSIAVMCFLGEGYESPYYAGMNLLYLAVGQFFAWDLRTSLAFAGIAYGFYMLPLMLGMLPIRDPVLALTNQFFLVSTILITVVSQVHRFDRLGREFAERNLHERLLAEARAERRVVTPVPGSPGARVRRARLRAARRMGRLAGSGPTLLARPERVASL